LISRTLLVIMTSLMQWRQVEKRKCDTRKRLKTSKMSQNEDEDCLIHMDNKTTWELAYSQHKKYLTSLIFRMTGSLSEAEEIVQDAFVEFLNIDSKSINNSRSWLTKVCINKAINHMKSAYKQREFYPGLWLPDEIPESLGDWNKVHEENSEESRLILTESLTTSFLL